MHVLLAGLLLAGEVQAGVAETGKLRLGAGVSAPCLPSVVAEYWLEEAPVMARVHFRTLGPFNSFAADIGYAVDTEGDFHQYIGVGLDRERHFNNVRTLAVPKYGFSYKGLLRMPVWPPAKTRA